MLRWTPKKPSVPYKTLEHQNTRRSENDSTLGRPRSENVNISWVWPFHTGNRFMVNCIQISVRNVISSLSSSWPKPVMENFKVPWNEQKLAEYGQFNSDLLHHTVHHPTKFRADSWNPYRVKAVTLSLRPGSSLFWKFQSSVERAKIGRALLFWKSNLLHVAVHHPTKFQANSWNPQRVRAVTSSLRPGQSISWKISKFRGTRKNWPNMAILYSDLLHGTVHHSTKF